MRGAAPTMTLLADESDLGTWRSSCLWLAAGLALVGLPFGLLSLGFSVASLYGRPSGFALLEAVFLLWLWSVPLLLGSVAILLVGARRQLDRRPSLSQRGLRRCRTLLWLAGSVTPLPIVALAGSASLVVLLTSGFGPAEIAFFGEGQGRDLLILLYLVAPVLAALAFYPLVFRLNRLLESLEGRSAADLRGIFD